MILREIPAHFVCINQHDHARVAAVMARNWKPVYFPGQERWQQVAYGVQEHDRGWIPLDATPLWDQEHQKPYSFIDFPLAPKLASYATGITEVVAIDDYAGLLCSLHYATFPDLGATAAGQAFVQAELARQKQIKATLSLHTGPAVQHLAFHLQLLKFCDGLSIYLCINEPGTAKAQEHPWYRQGIPYSEGFAFAQGQQVQASWLDSGTVALRPFPFTEAFTVTIPYRQVPKAQVHLPDGCQALQRTPYQQYQVRLVAG